MPFRLPPMGWLATMTACGSSSAAGSLARSPVIGTGANGGLPVLEEVETAARRRRVDLVVLPTAQAIEALAGKSADTNAILHLTC